MLLAVALTVVMVVALNAALGVALTVVLVVAKLSPAPGKMARIGRTFLGTPT